MVCLYLYYDNSLYEEGGRIMKKLLSMILALLMTV